MSAFSRSFLIAILACTSALAAAQATDNALPDPGPSRKARVPTAAEKTLPNGLRVVVASRTVTPLVSTTLYIRSGAEVDPVTMAGLADLTASLLDKGTATRGAPQIADAADSLGGDLTVGAGWDSSQLGITVTTPKLAGALELIADLVQHPKFAQEEIDRQRKQMLDQLQVSLSQPQTLASLVGRRAVFGDGGYGHSAQGTTASLPKIGRNDLIRLHDTYYRPDNALLVLAGDIDLDHAVQLASAAFGQWKNPTAALPAATPALGTAQLPAVVILDLPGTGQAAVSAVHAGIARNAPDYYVGLVANAVLGGSYSSRLNQEIRIKRGLSYGATSSLSSLRHGGSFGGSAQTKNPSATEVTSLLLGEFDRLGSQPVEADEFAARKATLSGNFGFSLETTRGLSGNVANLALYGVPLDDLGRHLDQIQAVTPAQVRDFAAAHLGREGTTVIVAGDAKQFAAALTKAYPKAERYSATAIDFDSPTLKATTAPSTQH